MSGVRKKAASRSLASVSLLESLTSQHAPNYTKAEAICHLGDLTVYPWSHLPDGKGEKEEKSFID